MARHPNWARTQIALATLVAGFLAVGSVAYVTPTASAFGSTSGTGLGQLDPSFGNATSTSGIFTGIGTAPVTCNASTTSLGYRSDASDIVVVGGYEVEPSVSGTCPSSGASEAVVAGFNAAGTNTWANQTVFTNSPTTSRIDGLSVVPGASGDIIAVGSETVSGQNYLAIAVLDSSGALIQDLKVPALASSGSPAFDGVAIGPTVTVGSSSGPSVYVTGSYTSSSDVTELVVGKYALAGTSSSPLVVDDDFGNQGSSSNLYESSIPSSVVSQGSTVAGLALNGPSSSPDVIVVGTSKQADSSCAGYSATSSNITRGFALALTSTGMVDTSFGSSGSTLVAPASLGGATATNCLSTGIDAVAGASQASANTDPPALLLAGYETTSATGANPSQSVALLTGLNTDGTVDSAFGTQGTVLSAGGSGSLNEAYSVAYVPQPGYSAPASIVVSGVDLTSESGAETYGVGLSHYSVSGVLDTTFGDGSLGTTVVPGCMASHLVCGEGVGVRSDGSINVVGGLSTQNSNSLAVAQFTDSEVQVSGPIGSLPVSYVKTPPAQFVVTLSSPNNPTLASVPGGVQVGYTTAGGTGNPGVNFASTTGTVVFPCNGSEPASVTSCSPTPYGYTAVVSVPTLYPSNGTGAATFALDLTTTTNAGLGSSSALATIEYPPPPPATTTTTPPAPTYSPTTTTAAPVAHTTTTTVTKANKATTWRPGYGYWTVSSNGRVFAFGDARNYGSARATKKSGPIIAIAASPTGKGYWLVSSFGDVYAHGDARRHGILARKRLHGVITGFQVTPNGKGYWMVSSYGNVYAFGNARFHGSVYANQRQGKIEAIQPTSGGKGYWLVSSTGRVYAFGSARHLRSIPRKDLRGRITGLAVGSRYAGYWLVSSIGRVYAFGDAHNYGWYGRHIAKHKVTRSKSRAKSIKSIKANSIVDLIEPTRHSIFERAITRQNVHTHKQTKKTKSKVSKRKSKRPAIVIIGIVAMPNFHGYWLVSSAGNIYHYGSAGFYGSPARAKHGLVTGIATT